MNFLTIEKFNPRSRTSVFKKIVLGLIMLVVPTMFVTAWAFYSLTETEITSKSQAVTKEFDQNELTLVTHKN